ncbi:MAG: DoxX family protein [Terracidiphilus sp.]
MNGLDWLAQILLTGVFLVDGYIRFSSYRRPVKSQLPSDGFATIRLPYELEVAVALAEIAGALALWVPANLWPPDILPRVAAAGLAMLAVAGSIYHVRRKEPSAYNLAVLLLAVLVIMGRWKW